MDIDFVGKNLTHDEFSIEDKGANYTIKYVSIPAGTKLYHGNNFEQENNILVGDLKYFLIDPVHAVDNQYGIMHEFETTIPLNLIRLDDKNTQKYLYETSDERIQLILENNFGYENGIRTSDQEPDAAVATFICELYKDSDYHGYLTDVMDTDMGGRFHPEIVICNPLDKLNFVKTTTPTEEHRGIIEEMKLKYRGKEERGRRKNKPKRSPIGPPSGMGTGGLFPYTPPGSPTGYGLFGPPTPGGKKSKKKKSKKKGNKHKTNKRKTSKNKRKRTNK